MTEPAITQELKDRLHVEEARLIAAILDHDDVPMEIRSQAKSCKLIRDQIRES